MLRDLSYGCAFHKNSPVAICDWTDAIKLPRENREPDNGDRATIPRP
jgi:hypothetical protein